MKKLYYGAYEYEETKDAPGDRKFIEEYGDKGYLMTKTASDELAIYYDGILYKQSRRYIEGETSGARINRRYRHGS